MSCCEIYGIRPDGEVREYGAAQNAWGGAMFVWNMISRKYFGRGFSLQDAQELWGEFDKQPSRLKGHEKIALGFTFDRVWVKRENVPRLVEGLQTFWKTNSVEGAIQTIPEVIEILRRAAVDPELIGVCFNQNSTIIGMWDVPMSYDDARVERGQDYSREEYEEEQPSRPFRFGKDPTLRGKEVWELFEEIDSAGSQLADVTTVL